MVLESRRVWASTYYERRGPIRSPPLTFPNDSEEPIHCWRNSERVSAWPEWDSNIRPSAPKSINLIIRPRRLLIVILSICDYSCFRGFILKAGFSFCLYQCLSFTRQPFTKK